MRGENILPSKFFESKVTECCPATPRPKPNEEPNVYIPPYKLPPSVKSVLDEVRATAEVMGNFSRITL